MIASLLFLSFSVCFLSVKAVDVCYNEVQLQTHVPGENGWVLDAPVLWATEYSMLSNKEVLNMSNYSNKATGTHVSSSLFDRLIYIRKALEQVRETYAAANDLASFDQETLTYNEFKSALLGPDVSDSSFFEGTKTTLAIYQMMLTYSLSMEESMRLLQKDNDGKAYIKQTRMQHVLNMKKNNGWQKGFMEYLIERLVRVSGHKQQSSELNSWTDQHKEKIIESALYMYWQKRAFDGQSHTCTCTLTLSGLSCDSHGDVRVECSSHPFLRLNWLCSPACRSGRTFTGGIIGAPQADTGTEEGTRCSL